METVRDNKLKIPERNPEFNDKEIFYIKDDDYRYINTCFKKNTEIDSISIANQFFLIEQILLESFQYVLPIEQNANTCSVKFATIVRESCNLFEIISRRLYHKFFVSEPSKRLNIYDFLVLDIFLNLSREELRAPTLRAYHLNGSNIEPFATLKDWDRIHNLNDTHIPKWWKAYNRIKHEVGSVCTNATLDNAIYSLSAVFLLIRKVYGDGLISGFLRNKENAASDTILYQIKTSDLFIGEILKTRGTGSR